MDQSALAFAFLQYVIFLFSTVCHEASHALAAKLGGDDTAAQAGQVSLDPLPHVQREPFGMVIVPLICLATSGGIIGWASAPYDPRWATRYPRRAGLMALAGPLANLALAFLAALLAIEGQRLGLIRHDLTLALAIACNLNLRLFLLNMLPVPPMDGSAALGLILPEDLARSWSDAMRNPLYANLGLVVAWTIFPRLAEPMINATYSWMVHYL